MKQRIIFYTLFFFPVLSFFNGNAQPSSSFNSFIPVSEQATTILIFPASIEDADLGTSAVQMEPFLRGENVLRLKALQQDFQPSNLCVITADGRLYEFHIVYDDYPSVTKHDFTLIDQQTLPPIVVRFPGNEPPRTSIDQTARLIAELPAIYHRPQDKAGEVNLALTGIYVQQGMLYFRFEVYNRSGIPYRPDGLRIFIRDRRKQKRSSERIQELSPHVLYMPMEVKAHQKTMWVAVFPLFTITDSKILHLQVGEKNGDRGLTLRIRGHKLLRSRPLLQ